jgi:hypothetical protein
MAVGFLFEAPGMTQEQYDQLMRGLNLAQAGADWPQGLISHAAGPMEGGWRVIDIWESEELARQFFQSRLVLQRRDSSIR